MGTDLGRSVIDTPEQRDRFLERAGLAGIGRYLEEQPRPLRILSGTASGQDAFWLHGIEEGVLFLSYWRPDLVETPEGIERLIAQTGVEAFVVPLESDGMREWFSPLWSRVDQLATCPGARTVDDRLFRLVVLADPPVCDGTSGPQRP
jgi:hypothetical protein